MSDSAMKRNNFSLCIYFLVSRLLVEQRIFLYNLVFEVLSRKILHYCFDGVHYERVSYQSQRGSFWRLPRPIILKVARDIQSLGLK